MSFEIAQNLLNEAVKCNGIDQLIMDENAYCALGAGEDKVIHIRFDSDTNAFVLLGSFGAVPPTEGDNADAERAAFLYAALLQANLFWTGLSGITIAAVPEGWLVLQQAIPLAGCTPQALSQALLTFSLQMINWTQRYADLQEAYMASVAPYYPQS